VRLNHGCQRELNLPGLETIEYSRWVCVHNGAVVVHKHDQDRTSLLAWAAVVGLLLLLVRRTGLWAWAATVMGAGGVDNSGGRAEMKQREREARALGKSGTGTAAAAAASGGGRGFSGLDLGVLVDAASDRVACSLDWLAGCVRSKSMTPKVKRSRSEEEEEEEYHPHLHDGGRDHSRQTRQSSEGSGLGSRQHSGNSHSGGWEVEDRAYGSGSSGGGERRGGAYRRRRSGQASHNGSPVGGGGSSGVARAIPSRGNADGNIYAYDPGALSMPGNVSTDPNPCRIVCPAPPLLRAHYLPPSSSALLTSHHCQHLCQHHYADGGE